MDRVLLAEDDLELLEKYHESLKLAEFEVIEAWTGSCMLSAFKKYGPEYFDVIVSDTEMPEMNGPEVVLRALEEGLLDRDSTLIFALSSDSNNQQYWRGLAHIASFYDKDYFETSSLGIKVRQGLINFRSGGLWREKMPLIE